MNKLIVSVIAVAVVVGGGAFFGGMKYAESKSPRGQFSRQGLEANTAGAFGGNHAGGENFRGGQRNGGGFTGGEIISQDDKSITVKLQDGGSKIIFLSDTTTVSKMTDGTKNDLAVGKQVTVNGTPNSDGSITAQNIQIRPNLPTTQNNSQ